jgi:Holliday junction DNA helicase RuvA
MYGIQNQLSGGAMISYVKGMLAEKSVNHAVVENNGLGYYLIISANSYQALPDVGEGVVLHTYLQIASQSDQMNLYGFSQKEEYDLFKTLISISGIGAKGAIKILSGISPRRFAEVVVAEDVGFLTKLPGIGKKSAQRIIVELRERLPALTDKKQAVPGIDSDRAEEVVQALMTLGMNAQESRRAIEKVIQTAGAKEAKILPTEEIIRRALTAGR